jgi:nucleotide-binding universal stress UspA family protein
MQGPPKTVLLATDLSARCDHAFDRSVSLTAEWQARLVVVHVREAPTDALGATDTVSSWRRAQDPQDMAEARIRAEISKVSPGLTVVIETGDTAEAILRAAEAHGCDLIVTGVARDETLGRLALGSTVAQLVRRSHIPILVVRKRGLRPYRHVVVATDFSESSRHALEAAVRYFPEPVLTLFNAYDAPMSGLVTDTASYREQFRAAAVRDGAAFLAASDLPVRQGQKPEVLIEYGDAERLIYEYVTERNVDLVAIGTHGRSAVFDVLIGSVAQGLLASLPCDTFIVREPRARAAG